MDRRNRLRLVRGAALLGSGAALAALAAFAPAPAARASGAPVPEAGPPAASTDAGAAAALPTVRGAGVPAEPSKAPSNAEWAEGKAARPHRGPPDPCELVLVREWLRLTCKKWAGASLVAGDPEGVKMWVAGDPIFGQRGAVLTVITPLRRGRSQVFTLLDIAWGYGFQTLGEAAALSVLWREGQEDPVIVLRPVGGF